MRKIEKQGRKDEKIEAKRCLETRKSKKSKESEKRLEKEKKQVNRSPVCTSTSTLRIVCSQ